MSRSYRKHSYRKTCGDKDYKKIFRRKYRRVHKNDYDLSNYNSYKKEDESWNICDIVLGWHSLDGYKKYCGHDDLTEEELADWKRWNSK